MGLYDSDRRYRRRSSGGLVRAGFYLATLGVVFAFAYQIGVERTGDAIAGLQARLQQSEAARATLEQETVRLAAEAQTANAQRDALQAQYARDVPQGELADLFVLIAMQLSAGVDSDRLAFMIMSAGAPANCTGVETKPLRIGTPSDQRAALDAVTFADNRITVTGRGAAAHDDEGNALPEFDPTAAVTVVFTAPGGTAEAISGVLPAYHSVAIGQTEHRFAVRAGAPGLVEITSDRCPIPSMDSGR